MPWSLRSVESIDADWIFEACQDPEIQRWTRVPSPYLREHAVGFTKDLAGDLAAWVIENEQIDKPCGLIGVHTVSEQDGVAEIGYWLAPWARGIGAMATGLQLLTQELIRWPTVRVIQATIAEENISSRRTVESAGFQLQGPSTASCPCGSEEVRAVSYRFTLVSG